MPRIWRGRIVVVATQGSFAYIRLAADHTGVPVPEVCRGLAQTHHG